MSIKQFEEKFAKSGLTFTNQRRLIAQVLIDLKGHPDIDEIFLKVRELDKTASIATVYRTVSLFMQLGLTVKREFKDSKSRYELSFERNHNHIIIEDGDIIEFTNKEIEDIIKKIVLENGLELEDYVIDIYCKKK
jgi:Fur family ferric uptake transcriptional regulator